MKRFQLLALTGCVVMVGCASQKQDPDVMSNAQLQSALQAQQQEWEAMKPQLERVLALEADLKLIVESLEPVPESQDSLTQQAPVVASDDMEGENTSSAPVLPSAALADMPNGNGSSQAKEPDPMATPEPSNISPFKQAPPKDAVTASFYGEEEKNRDFPYFGVQLAAYANETLARQGWRKMSRMYPEEFVDTAPLIHRSEVKGKTYYQLIVGPFLKKAYGDDFCNMLKQMQQDCLVTRYKGDPFLSL
ncbi:SPOR domain-containing protein [Rhodanobacter aciditrophus]|uniref:SPOR domain-containing protein n=1 Tax=Rhodanobacter aciditrophus TaxID=1623218 RepID=A0ABW4B471_9GAMM